MMKILFGLMFCVFFFTACEEEMIPISDRVVPVEGRVMLIEDMTGINCVPCFAGNIILEEAQEANNGSIVILGVHGKLNSEPIENTTYDFRHEDAIALLTELNVVSKPSGSFNRITFTNGEKIRAGFNTWAGIIDEELVKRQVSELKMLSTYDSENRTTRIDVSAIPLEDMPGELSLHVVISESHLIDSQASPTGIIFDYDHKHVMKKSLTGIKGDFLATDAMANEIIRKTYTYTVPEEVNGEWIPENMEITAFITSKDRDGEVQQAAQIHLTE